MKKKNQDVEELPTEGLPRGEERELTPKELKEQKKQERQESAQKRKKAKQRDKVARFAGIILLGMVLLIGFLLWVAGETQPVQQVSSPTHGVQGPVIVR